MPAKDPRYRTGQVNDGGKMICGAKNRQAEPCGQTIICTNGRCRMHNGKAASGIANANYRHGRYAKHLPKRLLAEYQVSRTDPRVLELGEQIAVIDTRIVDVMKRVDTGESGRVWRDLQDLVIAADEARRRQRSAVAKGDEQGDMNARREGSDLVGQIFRTIREEHTDYAAWDEVTNLILKRMRLVESERRRYKELHQMITAERALIIFDRMADSVREHVLGHVDGDVGRAILSGIQRDLGGILGSANAGAVATAGD